MGRHQIAFFKLVINYLAASSASAALSFIFAALASALSAATSALPAAA
jgi:hypothetical protein